MPNTEDAVMPILRNIQKDLADLKRETKDGLTEVRSDIRELSERLDGFEGYFTYVMGLTSRNKFDIKQLQSEFRALKDGVDELEPQT
jgi:hypothetical protein